MVANHALGGGRSLPRTLLHGYSLLTGKITGNSEQPPLETMRKAPYRQLLPALLPRNMRDLNREYLGSEQGISNNRAGNSSRHQRGVVSRDGARSRWRRSLYRYRR